MPNRRLLRRQFRQAWAETIRTTYMDQAISSERGLQVHLTAKLMEIFRSDGVTRRVFVEPLMRLDTGLAVHPDLLICNRQSIIGVVELKYQPKVKPNFYKDFATFESLAEHGESIEIVNRRFRGPDGDRGGYALSTDPMFVWAGVYRGPVCEIPGWHPEHFDKSQLLVLHAATRADAEPEILAASGSRTIVL